jgi:hypothetical protein
MGKMKLDFMSFSFVTCVNFVFNKSIFHFIKMGHLFPDKVYHN